MRKFIISKPTKFSENHSINLAIRNLLPFFDEISQQKMMKAIFNANKSLMKHKDENSDSNARHIFREFFPAEAFNKNGFKFEYNKKILQKKPDWVDETSNLLIESFTYERAGNSNVFDRVTNQIHDKNQKYFEVIQSKPYQFIISVYLDFKTYMTFEEIEEEKLWIKSVFTENPTLWAILFFC